jgi:hypothetical protein
MTCGSLVAAGGFLFFILGEETFFGREERSVQQNIEVNRLK